MKERGRLRISNFFFFQAEDGIRDYKVTGVQTCALPISHGGRDYRTRAPEYRTPPPPRSKYPTLPSGSPAPPPTPDAASGASPPRTRTRGTGRRRRGRAPAPVARDGPGRRPLRRSRGRARDGSGARP